MNDDLDPKTEPERSAIASDIHDLQATVKRLSEERDRLPQPLFWSLFHTRLNAIKKHKDLKRTVAAALGESES